MVHWIYYACDISEALASVRGAINGFPNLVLSIAYEVGMGVMVIW